MPHSFRIPPGGFRLSEPGRFPQTRRCGSDKRRPPRQARVISFPVWQRIFQIDTATASRWRVLLRQDRGGSRIHANPALTEQRPPRKAQGDALQRLVTKLFSRQGSRESTDPR